jgi:hypothetical protein
MTAFRRAGAGRHLDVDLSFAIQAGRRILRRRASEPAPWPELRAAAITGGRQA